MAGGAAGVSSLPPISHPLAAIGGRTRSSGGQDRLWSVSTAGSPSICRGPLLSRRSLPVAVVIITDALHTPRTVVGLFLLPVCPFWAGRPVGVCAV